MARFGRLFLITLLLLGLMLSTTAVITGCGEETTTTGTSAAPATTATAPKADSGAIGERVLTVLAGSPTGSQEYAANSITAAKLSALLADPAEKDKLFILDIRSKADYDAGHIEGATQIDFADWASEANLAKLPQDKKIIVVCYTGTTSAQAMMGMRIIGYDAAVLRAGMNSWTQTGMTQTVVSELESATVKPVVTTPSTVTAEAAPAGTPFEKPSDADAKAFADKAARIMSEMPKSGEYANYIITADELSQKLAGADKDELFLVDIRQKAAYDEGHIDGAVNIPFLSVPVPANLSQLPKDKKIVVICYTGNTAAQATTILRFLDYDAVVLKYAMMAWNDSGKEGYLTEIKAAGFPTVKS